MEWRKIIRVWRVCVILIKINSFIYFFFIWVDVGLYIELIIDFFLLLVYKVGIIFDVNMLLINFKKFLNNKLKILNKINF